jgi:hypothetical protein
VSKDNRVSEHSAAGGAVSFKLGAIARPIVATCFIKVVL